MRNELDKIVKNPSETWFQESGNANTFPSSSFVFDPLMNCTVNPNSK